ncbi:YbaN family protein [Pseudooceanicola aestuarii]|uniref:YbaN family protein n=1 Tax=Pseudooceanicola aestuarii TaxID=2697319 RepID=UPI0013D4C566|nr:YbaN family protein [Pseudooceanicola aestuarii]
MRLLWAVFGFTALALGGLGIALPLLPTVPFLLLATFCFARSSERLHNWLINHEKLGPPIRDWQENGAISRRAKVLATLSVLAVFCLSAAIGLRSELLMIQGATLCCVMVFLWTRPNGPR